MRQPRQETNIRNGNFKNNLINNSNGNSTRPTDEYELISKLPIIALPHVYNEKKKEMKLKMANLKNAHIRYIRGVEKYEVISNQKMVIEDPQLDLTTPLSYGLYIHGRLQKNPKRIERITKCILLDLNDANYALSCSYVFWKWMNEIIFKNCTDDLIQQCKNRILKKERKRWWYNDDENEGIAGINSSKFEDHKDKVKKKKQLKIDHVLNDTIQYIEKYLRYDVHFC